MRRILLVLSVALVMAAMLANAMPASAEGLAKGQDNSNPGFVNDSVGDAANNVCELSRPWVPTPQSEVCQRFAHEP